MTTINFLRDMRWPDYVGAVGAVTGSLDGTLLNIGVDGAVAQRVQSAWLSPQTIASSATLGHCSTFGVLLLPPVDEDNTCYRFQGSVHGADWVAWGFGPYTSSGSTVSAGRVLVGAGPSVDQTLAIPALDSADPDYGKPFAFFAAIGRANGGVGLGALCAQRLLSMPPQFSAAMS